MAKKQRLTRLRFRKGDPSHNLLAAVQHYIIAMGGDAIVIGGVNIEWANAFQPSKYRVSVDCLGKPPQKPAEKE